MLFYLMISIMVLFTVYHFYIDIKGKLNTGNTFAEGMQNQEAPSGYEYTGESQCQDWGIIIMYYVKTSLNGTDCGV